MTIAIHREAVIVPSTNSEQSLKMNVYDGCVYPPQSIVSPVIGIYRQCQYLDWPYNIIIVSNKTIYMRYKSSGIEEEIVTVGRGERAKAWAGRLPRMLVRDMGARKRKKWKTADNSILINANVQCVYEIFYIGNDFIIQQNTQMCTNVHMS